MVDADVMYYPEWQGSSGMETPVIQFCPGPVTAITLKMKVKTASELTIGTLGECIQTADDYGDLEDITMCTVDSVVGMFIVLDTVDNIKQLKIDNSVYAHTKALFFAAGSYIDVAILLPGMIIECILFAAENAILKPGLSVYFQAAGQVGLDTGAQTFLMRLGKALCDCIVSTETERIIVVVTF